MESDNRQFWKVKRYLVRQAKGRLPKFKPGGVQLYSRAKLRYKINKVLWKRRLMRGDYMPFYYDILFVKEGQTTLTKMMDQKFMPVDLMIDKLIGWIVNHCERTRGCYYMNYLMDKLSEVGIHSTDVHGAYVYKKKGGAKKSTEAFKKHVLKEDDMVIDEDELLDLV